MLSKRGLFVAYLNTEVLVEPTIMNKQQRIGSRFFRVVAFQMGNLLINLI